MIFLPSSRSNSISSSHFQSLATVQPSTQALSQSFPFVQSLDSRSILIKTKMVSPSAFVPHTPLPSRQSTASSAISMCEKPDEKPIPKKPIKTVRSSASWANVFLPQFGQKGPGSRPEFDLRPTSIRTDAENPDICDCCRGTGRIKCSFCSGLQMYETDGSEKMCPACDNKFMVTCSVCFGNKTSIELTDKWWEKGVAALFNK